jgi:hypothetical protein
LSKENEVKIFIRGNNKRKYKMTSMSKVIFDFSLNDIIKRVTKLKSATAIKTLVNGSASNKPVNNRRPKGSKIIEPFKKMKK